MYVLRKYVRLNGYFLAFGRKNYDISRDISHFLCIDPLIVGAKDSSERHDFPKEETSLVVFSAKVFNDCRCFKVPFMQDARVNANLSA